MLVKVLNFGTNWWARPGDDPEDPFRFTYHAAYFNSTGVRCGRNIQRHWIVPGLVRFNFGCINPHFPNRSIGCIFRCTDLVFACGGNRLLAERRASRLAIPDCYLVVVSDLEHGAIDLRMRAWKSPGAAIIAASHVREQQEVMLLMRPGDWFQTRSGYWELRFPHKNGRRAELHVKWFPVDASLGV